MSEYQLYEFAAIDRPLNAKEIADLRAISTRAEITPARFRNEYQFGQLKADPRRLLEQYFDAHLYLANWGTRRLMLRLPKARVDLNALRPYFAGDGSTDLSRTRSHVILELCSEEEGGDWDEMVGASLAELTGLREELMQGDFRPAYLAWLFAVQQEEIPQLIEEPPVPSGLAALTAAQSALVEFLRIDEALVATAAAEAGSEPEDAASRFRRWISCLPPEEKDRLLQMAAEDPALPLGGELLRRFRAAEKRSAGTPRRTVAELLALAEDERARRSKAAVARARKHAKAAEVESTRRLDALARNLGGSWKELERLVEERAYVEALKLAGDLLALAERERKLGAFQKRFATLRKRQGRKRSFFERWARIARTPAT